jgi:hypothetical protein
MLIILPVGPRPAWIQVPGSPFFDGLPGVLLLHYSWLSGMLFLLSSGEMANFSGSVVLCALRLHLYL